MTDKVPEPKYPDGEYAKFTRGRPAARARRLDGEAREPVLREGLCEPMWGHFFGRGLVNEVDDMRETNRPAARRSWMLSRMSFAAVVST